MLQQRHFQSTRIKVKGEISIHLQVGIACLQNLKLKLKLPLKLFRNCVFHYWNFLRNNVNFFSTGRAGTKRYFVLFFDLFFFFKKFQKSIYFFVESSAMSAIEMLLITLAKLIGAKNIFSLPLWKKALAPLPLPSVCRTKYFWMLGFHSLFSLSKDWHLKEDFRVR